MSDTSIGDGIKANRSPDGTRAAARQLVRSIGADLRGLAARVVRPAPSSATLLASNPAARIGRWCKPLAKCIAGVAVVGGLVLALTMLWVLRDLPLDIDSAEAREREILLEAANGNPLGRVGPLRISNATRDEFPAHVVNAVLSVEDRRFYQHWGIDWFGIARASARNYWAGTILEGGSSITQQLVKLRIVGPGKDFWSKGPRGLWRDLARDAFEQRRNPYAVPE